ncbi:MAG: YidC/Oxa1 family membrane protein insertase, partial [Firmicutes bacterium]|nr:YidC/Oxa1 family membrane protein insertase [Bacillota bacterium]
MSFLSIIETILIGPLKLVFEIIYNLAYRMVGHPGLAIIFLSFVMNILVLPLYKQADLMQEKTKDTEARLAPGVAHIKKAFSGDERMMILQTYYRQMHYKPASALSGSVSLLLEIPFFMAAYQFLSNLTILDGVAFGPIADLGAPDAMFTIGGFTVNVLPVLMTVINIISSALYLKGFPLKSKIQLYAMAMFFLVFLYTSPSALVFYWTLNNLFSLIKNIFYKIPNPKRVLQVLCAVAGLGIIVYTVGFFETQSLKVKLVLLAVGVLLLVPLVWEVLKKWVKLPQAKEAPKPDKKTFLLGSLFLTVLIGVHIPATFIAASPQEYVNVYNFHHPLWYVAASAAMAAGLFLVWLRVFYWLANPRGKVLFERLVWILSILLLVNYMFFGTDMGVISSTLQYDTAFVFSRTEQLVNLAVMTVLAAVLYFTAVK